MSTAICELSDLPVDQCACRVHAAPEHRTVASGAGASRDGHPTAGAAEHLDSEDVGVITTTRFPRVLAEIATGSGPHAVHGFAQFCADAGHWQEPARPERARLVAALARAVAARTRMSPVDVLALVADAEPVPWEDADRRTWVARIDAAHARRPADHPG